MLSARWQIHRNYRSNRRAGSPLPGKEENHQGQRAKRTHKSVNRQAGLDILACRYVRVGPHLSSNLCHDALRVGTQFLKSCDVGLTPRILRVGAGNIALRAVLDDLTDDVDSPARADSLLIDVFSNEDGTQLVFRMHEPFLYAHHFETMNAWALVARTGERSRLISLARMLPHHQQAIATLDGMLARVRERNAD